MIYSLLLLYAIKLMIRVFHWYIDVIIWIGHMWHRKDLRYPQYAYEMHISYLSQEFQLSLQIKSLGLKV